jgi:hypothetical protein
MSTSGLIIRDLPGIATLEDKLLLYRGQYEGAEDDFAGKVAYELFGVTASDVANAYAAEENDLFTRWEWTDDETVGGMLALGVDFRDERGQPLRCTLPLAGAVEIAVKGIAGRVPDPNKAALDRLASNLERDRDAFMARKRARR